VSPPPPPAAPPPPPVPVTPLAEFYQRLARVKALVVEAENMALAVDQFTNALERDLLAASGKKISSVRDSIVGAEGYADHTLDRVRRLKAAIALLSEQAVIVLPPT
jgi:hypothetical protein